MPYVYSVFLFNTLLLLLTIPAVLGNETHYLYATIPVSYFCDIIRRLFVIELSVCLHINV